MRRSPSPPCRVFSFSTCPYLLHAACRVTPKAVAISDQVWPVFLLCFTQFSSARSIRRRSCARNRRFSRMYDSPAFTASARGQAPLEGGAAVGVSLDTSRTKLPPLADADSRRDARYLQREALWRWSSLPRLRGCGRKACDPKGVGMVSQARGGRAGFTGLTTCASVWACPCCSAKIHAVRALESQIRLVEVYKAGGRAYLLTLTLRHGADHQLDVLWSVLLSSWQAVQRAAVGRKKQALSGFLGFIRSVEVTTGRNGWHPHLHLLMCFDGLSSSVVEADYLDWIVGKWLRVVAVGGLQAVAAAQDWQLLRTVDDACEAGRYLTVANAVGRASLEAFGQAGKRSRSVLGTAPVWSIVADFLDTGDADLLSRWHAWEKNSKGRRQYGASRALAQRFPLPDVSDDEAVSLSSGEAVSLYIMGGSWPKILAAPWPASALLTACETGGWAAVASLLDSVGAAYEFVKDA